MISMACHDDFNGMCVRERAGGMPGEVTMISMACVREREREQEACQERSR